LKRSEVTGKEWKVWDHSNDFTLEIKGGIAGLYIFLIFPVPPKAFGGNERPFKQSVGLIPTTSFYGTTFPVFNQIRMVDPPRSYLPVWGKKSIITFCPDLKTMMRWERSPDVV
jgi:hypothetical protein